MTQVDGGATKFTYNALNQRVRIDQNGGDSQEYVFNANGQRVSVWDPQAGWEDQGQNYWGSTPVEFYQDGYAQFQHQDYLGTERMRTSYSGAVDGTFTSLPFGDGYSVSGNDNDPHHFAVLDRDAASDTDHAQFRQYANTAGRWMSPDPYSGSYDVNNPQSMNRYTYVLNNPLAYVDPDGTTSPCPGDGSCDDCATAECSIFYPNGMPDEPSGAPIPGTAYSDGQGNTYTLLGYNGIGDGLFLYLPDTMWGSEGDVDLGGPVPAFWFSLIPAYGQTPPLINGGGGGGGGGGGVASPGPNNSSSKYPTRMFGTHWCGPGGAGPTVNQLDAACKAHDQCYDAHGFGPSSNWNPFQSPNQIQALQQCNQNLCNAAAQTNDPGSTRVVLFFEQVVPVGACRP